MGEILERSLTEMDWLLQLNGWTASVDSVETDSRADSSDGYESGTSSAFHGSSVNHVSQHHHNQQNSLEYRGRNAKPPFSYTHLITLAISSTPRKRMALSEIYQWIKDNYPYYKTAAPGWKNSVRHNLSLNKNFVKVARRKDEPGKGAYWALESSVIKKLSGRPLDTAMNTERVPLVSRENEYLQSASRSYSYPVVDDETAFAVESISQQHQQQHHYPHLQHHQHPHHVHGGVAAINTNVPIMTAYSPLDYSDEEEVQAVIDEAETAAEVAGLEQASAAALEAEFGHNLDWFRSSFNGKLDSSIDLDLLMASLKSDVNGKSINFDQLSDLACLQSSTGATSVGHRVLDRKCIEDEVLSHDLQNLTELRPVFDSSTHSTEFEHFTSLCHDQEQQSVQYATPIGSTSYLLDHSSYTFQPQSLTVQRPFPQQTIAVVARSRVVPATGHVVVAHNRRHDPIEDDIEDDFNWENLIDKSDDVRPTLPSVATHC